jgi:hypothetical protein
MAVLQSASVFIASVCWKHCPALGVHEHGAPVTSNRQSAHALLVAFAH